MVKNLIDFFIVVDLLLPQFLAFAVGLLQLEPHTANTGLIKLLIGKLGLESTPETLGLWQSVGFADENLVVGREAQKHGVEILN